jgi:hypothetical protein
MFMIVDAETEISLISFKTLEEAEDAVSKYTKRHRRQYLIIKIGEKI